MTATRRKRGTSGEVRTLREDRQRAAIARRRKPDYTAAQAEAAQARLDPLYGIVIVEDDPLAPDATYYADLESDVPPMVQDIGARADAKSSRRPVSRRTARKPLPASVIVAAALAPRATAPVQLVCPRCGRTDWRANGVGLQWHLDNYPRCADDPRKADHTYSTIGA